MKLRFSCIIPRYILLALCLSGWTQLLSIENPGKVIHQPPCPGGKDTTYIICPHYDHYNNLLFGNNLPYNGIWYPPLQDTFGVIYNSCDDGQSMYIYPHEYPGCPTVMDTARFQLYWDPCGWELENVCYTSDSIFFTIPAYPGAPGLTRYWFNWFFPGQTFSLDSSYQLSVPNPGGSNYYDLHISFETAPYCWWTFGELLAWDFYGAQAEQPCNDMDTLCRAGKDTTFTICPFKGYVPGLLDLVDLPLEGTWEPALHNQEWVGYYDSCADSASSYIYTTSIPGCPDVQDTAFFKLRWNPPCGWEYNACYRSNQIELNIPAYPGFEGSVYTVEMFAGAGNGSNFIWEYCNSFALDPNIANTVTCDQSWDNDDYSAICVDVRLTEAISGCQWYYPPFDFNYEYWDCNVSYCDITEVETTDFFRPRLVYPVPADDVLHVASGTPVVKVMISGTDGRLYKEVNSPAANQISLADIAPGYYIVSLFDGFQWHTSRMIKL